jgi:Immunoglobulin domain/Fibronectin type III domain/NHL repeat
VGGLCVVKYLKTILSFIFICSCVLSIRAQTIITQPQNQTVMAGTNLSFTVVATGATSYQWLFNGVAITGATQSTLTLTQVTSAQSGTYAVLVFSTTNSIQSSSATLNVINVPAAQSYTFYAGLPNLIFVGINNSQLSYTINNLPAGLSYDPITGYVSGSISQEGTYNFNINAISNVTITNSTSSVVVMQTINVLAMPLTTQVCQGGVQNLSGLTIDSAGNIYATSGNQVFFISVSGSFVTGSSVYAGNITSGGIDGSLLSATFNSPTGIVIDSVGNLYIVDTGNSTVRKISSSGTVTTLAGVAGLKGNVDGSGAIARFNQPQGIALDNLGNIYVADTGNGTIRKITNNGIVTTLALSGANIVSPCSLTFDSNNNLYFVDSSNGSIYRVGNNGFLTLVTQVSGSYSSLGHTYTTYFSGGITTDILGNIYAAFSYASGVLNNTNKFIKITPAGVQTYINAPVGVPNASPIIHDSVGNFYYSGSSNLCIAGYPTAPYITSQPVSLTLSNNYIGGAPNYSFNINANVTLGGSNGSYPMSIQWYLNSNAINASMPLSVSYTNLSNGGRYPNGYYSQLFGPLGSSGIPATGSYYAQVSTPYSAILSNVATLSSVTLPDPPTNLIATSGNSQITLSFNAPVNSGGSPIISYIVTATPVGGSPVSVTGNSSPITVSGLTNNNAYYVSVVDTTSVGSSASVSVSNKVYPGIYISSQPSSLSVNIGNPATFTVGVTGSNGVTYQWYFNGTAITGATSSSYTIPTVSLANAGTYYVVATISGLGASILTSSTVSLSVNSPPAILSQPITTTVTQGSPVSLSVSNTGTGCTYQWYFNGTPITGATNSTYSISSMTSSKVGNYTVTITNAGGSVSSSPATVALNGSRLGNLSLLGIINSSNPVFTTGFIIEGTVPETVLIRAVGQGLTPYVASGTSLLQSPQLSVFDSSGAVIQKNSAWGGSISLQNAFISTGAFSLNASSNDAAILIQLQPGAYTAQVNGLNGSTGEVLIEVYEVSSP